LRELPVGADKVSVWKTEQYCESERERPALLNLFCGKGHAQMQVAIGRFRAEKRRRKCCGFLNEGWGVIVSFFAVKSPVCLVSSTLLKNILNKSINTVVSAYKW